MFTPHPFPSAALRLALQSGLRPNVLMDALLLSEDGGAGEQMYQSFKPIINRCGLRVVWGHPYLE